MIKKPKSTTLPFEDLPGILRTIYLLLDYLDFHETVKALESETTRYNFPEILSTPAKTLILLPIFLGKSDIKSNCVEETNREETIKIGIHYEKFNKETEENGDFLQYFQQLVESENDEFISITLRIMETVKTYSPMNCNENNNKESMKIKEKEHRPENDRIEEKVRSIFYDDNDDQVVPNISDNGVNLLTNRTNLDCVILKVDKVCENTDNNKRASPEANLVKSTATNTMAESSYKEYVTDKCGCSPYKDNFPLDFKKVKCHLLKGDDSTKELLLQALRWRITQNNEYTRYSEIMSFICNNLVGIRCSISDSSQDSILKACLERPLIIDGKKNHVQENTARLLNCFASFKVGRDYLCQDEEFLIETLLTILTKEKSSTTLDMVIATLQKLSVRKRPRLLLIAGGCIQFLVSFLSNNHEKLTDYCLEYSTALLMNLCLQKESKHICRDCSFELVNLLTTLLLGYRESCVPYVNGTLFSIIKDKEINDEAKDSSLGVAILHQAKITTNEDVKEQLEIIYRMHTNENFNVCPCKPIEAIMEIDLLEPELDFDDCVSGEYYGESFLEFYRLNGDSDEGPYSFQQKCTPFQLNQYMIRTNKKEELPNQNKTKAGNKDEAVKVALTPDQQQENQKNVEEIIEEIYKKADFSTKTTIPYYDNLADFVSEDQLNESQKEVEKIIEYIYKETDFVKVSSEKEDLISTVDSTSKTVTQKNSLEQQGLEESNVNNKITNEVAPTKKDPQKSNQKAEKVTPKVEILQKPKDLITVEDTVPLAPVSSNKPVTVTLRVKPKPIQRSYLEHLTRRSGIPSSRNNTSLRNTTSTKLPGLCSSRIKQWDIVEPKTKCQKDDVKEESTRKPMKKWDSGMPLSFFGCYKDCSDSGRMFLARTSPCSCKTGQLCLKHATHNKYACSCYEKIKSYVEQLDNKDGSSSSNKSEPEYKQSVYHQVRCHMTGFSEDNSEYGLKRNKGNITENPVSAEMTIPYYENYVRMFDDNKDAYEPQGCHYYNVVFQSRPKIERTPPH